MSLIAQRKTSGHRPAGRRPEGVMQMLNWALTFFASGVTCGGSGVHRRRGSRGRHRKDILLLVSRALHCVLNWVTI